MYRNKDHETFCRKGIGEIYETIGSLNLFMQCDAPNRDAFRSLPDGYSFRLCRRDELEIWKRVVVEEAYIDNVTDFYEKIYAQHEDEFFQCCMFVCNAADKPVASTLIWKSYGLINTVGWFRVLPEYEGKELGRALLSEIFKTAQFPIYLHTQPTSARAIKLYSDFGFKLITDTKIGYRKNDLDESFSYLQKLLLKNDYEKLQFTKANNELLNAALSNKTSEF
ncbi:MAG: GNAT family N-acetyltransferase [Alphaproteobacteria bacterium]|nr:GNAT family N-acetyltransferase [Alphaproteobacteria bacterium]MCL2504842.1 GNAT family N-acetyltransferase [Alphaproteobacteria bacterium]